jgi:hypothetical protein
MRWDRRSAWLLAVVILEMQNKTMIEMVTPIRRRSKWAMDMARVVGDMSGGKGVVELWKLYT